MNNDLQDELKRNEAIEKSSKIVRTHLVMMRKIFNERSPSDIKNISAKSSLKRERPRSFQKNVVQREERYQTTPENVKKY
ncbi:hypothetical protein H5410_000796 [Solanum commersonii]|uniref:Uncharacterized protein n=1 Tax=Solanum commersonii TaxID=4109 RepID=A0A9J6AY98_SOLCO|nr:hypothetical protein H5410_000796 [Solanum commersonii]